MKKYRVTLAMIRKEEMKCKCEIKIFIWFDVQRGGEKWKWRREVEVVINKVELKI